MVETDNLDVHSGDEIDILDLLIVVAKNKKMILRNTFGAAVIAVVISLLLPNIYTASTTILPPQKDQSTASAMLGQLGALAGMGGGGFGMKNPDDLYIGILKSVTLENAMIRRFDLMKRYKAKMMAAARKVLEANSDISSDKKSGFIKIEISDKDPRLAAEVANAYVEELNKLTAGLAITEASQKRLFYEKQLDQVRKNQAKAELELQQTQQKMGGMIQLYPVEKEIATSSAMLRADIAAKEVELSAMKIAVTPNNPEYVRLKQEIESMKAKLNGADPGDSLSANMDGKSLAYIDKFREVKFEQAVMELLFQQYEAAKIDEAKDYPLIQVLDKATTPERKSKPKRAIIVIMSMLIAFVLSILWSFLKDAIEKEKSDTRRSERLETLKTLILSRK